MKYTGKEDRIWHTVTDDNDRKYWLALSARVVLLEESYDTLAEDIRRQRDMEYTVFTREKGKPFPATWPGVFDEDLRKQIIATAWPMVLE